MNYFPEFEAKMRGAGLSAAAINAFRHSYDTLVAGHTGMIPESSIQPVMDLPRMRSADFQSAVSQNSILQDARQANASGKVERSADCKSAIRQIENLRYED